MIVLVAVLALLVWLAICAGAVVAGLVYALVWLAAFASPLGHRTQMQRLHGRARLGARWPGRNAMAAYDAQTSRMIEAARSRRRDEQAQRPRRVWR